MGLTKEQIEFRKKGIGGSDAAAVLGISPYTSPLELWLEKTGRVEAVSNDSTRLRAGSFNEEFVLGEIGLGLPSANLKVHGPGWMGEGLELGPGVTSHQNEVYPFMLGNTDASIAHTRGIVEVKTSDEFPFMRKWGSGVPLYVQAQCQHYMAAVGADYTVVACLQGFHTVNLWLVELDAEFIQNKLIPAELEFWGWVESDTMPPADDSESSERALRILYPEPEPKKTIKLTDREHVLAEQYIAAKESISVHTKKKRGFQNYLSEAMGDAEIGVLTNGVELHRTKAGRGWTFKLKEPKQ
jgi:predicted phage-related endonuclease